MSIEILSKETLAAAQIQILSKEELAGVDIILVIDKSGSMEAKSIRKAATPKKGLFGFGGGSSSKNRFEEVKEDALVVAQLAEQHDDDGITIIAFSNDVIVYDGITSDKVDGVFKTFRPGGTTNLAAALQAAVKKAEASEKKAVIIVYTDGVPDSQQDAFRVINEAGKKFGRPKIGFTFIQVGEEPNAAEFLRRINDDLEVDVCAAVSAVEAQTLSVEQLIWLAQNA